MEPFGVEEALVWTDGALASGDAQASFDAVVIDSRRVEPGSLFVAIVGPHHDAHRFVPDVASRGAAGVVVQRDRAEEFASSGMAVIAVEDTTIGLGRMAAGHRGRFEGPLVGITGSSGKTTTKEMCAAILRAKASCLMTEGNLNNDFGLPLTLLRRDASHELAVIELGMNHRGEIARLAEIARPTVALITNVGTAHIEFLGSREEIAREKGDLFAALGREGIAAVNHDDPRVVEQAERVAGRCIGYATRPGADVVAHGVRFLAEGRFVFTVSTPWGEAEVSVTGLGETTVINAVAAATAALAASAELDHVVRGLEAYRPIRGRMAPVTVAPGATVIDDTYNANPQSMREALSSLGRLAGGGRRFAVVGDMGELGETRDAAHRDTGRAASEVELDGLLALGDCAEKTVSGAIDAGMDPARARVVADHAEAADAIRSMLREGDWVLVKGSRAMRMERIVEMLAGEDASG